MQHDPFPPQSEHPNPDGWVSLFELIVEGSTPLIDVVTAIQGTGVYRVGALGSAVKASEAEAEAICYRIDRYAYLLRSDDYAEREELLEMTDGSCSRFVMYGWLKWTLPPRLMAAEVDSAAIHQGRLDEARRLGLTLHGGEGVILRREGIGAAATKMKLTRQALAESIDIAYADEEKRRREGLL